MMFMADCKVFLCTAPVDMRKSYEGLSALTQSVLCANPLSGHLFVFLNSKRNRIKMLYWNLNGFCIMQKRLEKGRFHMPNMSCEASVSLSMCQLNGLFQGIAWEKIPKPTSLNYKFI